MKLKGKVAIVTGAGQTPGQTMGTGRATALAYAREGAKLFLVDLDESSVKETKDLIIREGGEATYQIADITDSYQCAEFARECIKQYKQIDILQNNAGLMQGDNSVTQLDENAWNRIHDVNVKGIYLCCKHVLPYMYERHTGVVTNISSTGSLWSGDNYFAYNVSKSAVNGITTALVIECASNGVRVNAIMPGFLDTPFGVDATVDSKNLDRDTYAQERSTVIPLNQEMGDAWDVANASVFLASDDARFITGAIIPIDGGQLLNRI